MTFTEWLDENWEPNNECPPPMDAQVAINFLSDYLIGENWYVALPLSQEQVNTEIVNKILDKFSSRFWKEEDKHGKH